MALVFIDSLIDGLVGGVAFGVLLVLVAMAMAVPAVVRVRGCSNKTNDCKDKDGSRLHLECCDVKRCLVELCCGCQVDD